MVPAGSCCKKGHSMTRNLIRPREAWIIALALFLAIRALEAQENSPSDELEDMRILLRETYPTHAAVLEAMTQAH
jgi:hypothetical protein